MVEPTAAPPGANASQHASAAPPPAPQAAASSATGPASSLLQSLQQLWSDLPGLLSDRVELLALELRQAGIALMQIVVFVIAAAILGVTAWVSMWAGIVAALWSLGLHIGWALVVAMAINVVAAAVAIMLVRQRLERLQLPATRRHLTVQSALKPSPDELADPLRGSAPQGQPVAS